MKKMLIIVLSLSLMISLAGVSFADQGTWQYDGFGWWYLNSDWTYPVNSWLKDGEYWYYFDSDGYMITGWFVDDGAVYYMYTSGAMATGWVFDEGDWYYMSGSGRMQTGWIQYNSDWYYLLPEGNMATGTVEINNQLNKFSDDGRWEGTIDNNQNNGGDVVSGHTHHYYEDEWKIAGCGEPLYITWLCSCGDSYTEILPFKPEYHMTDWLEEVGRRPIYDNSIGDVLCYVPILRCPVCGYEIEGDYIFIYTQ